MPIDAKDFMELLSRVLETVPTLNDDVSKILHELDDLLRDKLPEALNTAKHPDAPGLTARCAAFCDAMELAVTSRHILDKPIVLLEGDIPNHSLTYLKGCVKFPIPEVCLNTDCEIPILVIHGEETRMSTVNYAGASVSVNLEDEYVKLLEGSKRFNVKLSRILKCFILTTPLKTTAGTFLLMGKEMKSAFNRFIAMRFLVTQDPLSSQNPENKKDKYAGVLCEKAGMGKKWLTAQDFAEKMMGQISIPLYGLNEEFFRLTGDILNHFMASIRHSEKLVEDLTDDIIRMESSLSSTQKRKENEPE